jgi:hypothetical protein
MNAYEKALEMNLSGEPAEVVAILNAITAGPIPVANVLQYFDEQNLAEWDPLADDWVGSLVTVARNQSTPSPIVAGLRKVFVHLAKRTSQTIDTTDPVIAVETLALLGALIQMGVVTTTQRDAFYDLDGGRPYASLTVEQYNELKTASETAAAKADAVTAVIVKATAAREAAEAEARIAESTPTTIAAAAETAWGA